MQLQKFFSATRIWTMLVLIASIHGCVTDASESLSLSAASGDGGFATTSAELTTPLLSSVQVTTVRSSVGSESIASTQTTTALVHQGTITVTVRELGYACSRVASANGFVATAGAPVPIGNPATGFDVPWTIPTIAGDFIFSTTSVSCNGGPTLSDSLTVRSGVTAPPPVDGGTPVCTSYNLGGSSLVKAYNPPSLRAYNNRIVVTVTGNTLTVAGPVYANEWQNGASLTGWYPIGTQLTSRPTMMRVERATSTAPFELNVYALERPTSTTYRQLRAKYLGQKSWGTWTLFRSDSANYASGPRANITLNGKKYSVSLDATWNTILQECI